MKGHILCFKLVEADLLSAKVFGCSGIWLGYYMESSSDDEDSSSSESGEEDNGSDDESNGWQDDGSD